MKPELYQELIESVKSFALLKKNWDSYDAEPFSSLCIEIAIKEIEKIKKEDFEVDDILVNVYPTSDESILIEKREIFENETIITEIDVYNDGDVQRITYEE